MLDFVLAYMQNHLGVGIEHNHIFHVLGKVEILAYFQILEFIPLADDLDHGFWHKLDSLVLFIRFSEENGDIRSFQRSVGKA